MGSVSGQPFSDLYRDIWLGSSLISGSAWTLTTKICSKKQDVDQCYTNFSTFINHETCLSNTAGLKECSHFPFSSLPSIQSTLWFIWWKQTLSFCFHCFFIFYFCPSPTVGVLLVWVQFLIHIGSGRWIWSSCSPSLFHFKRRLLFQLIQSPHGYVKRTNMLRKRW